MRNPPELTFDPATHAYAWRGFPVPSVTQVTKRAGYQKDYTGIDSAVMERKRLIGIAVHKAADMLLKGTPPKTMLEDALPYWRAFDTWMARTKPDILGSEAKVFSPALNVAGTFDALLRLDFRGSHVEAVVDWKTTSRLDVSVGPQLAGYDILDRANEKMNDVSERYGERHRFALWITPEKAELRRYKDDDDYDAFIGAAWGYHWRHKRGRL